MWEAMGVRDTGCPRNRDFGRNGLGGKPGSWGEGVAFGGPKQMAPGEGQHIKKSPSVLPYNYHFILFIYFLIFILFICAYNVWVISPPFSLPPPFPPPSLPGRNYSTLISNFVEERV
jgi:hypothetical protein